MPTPLIHSHAIMGPQQHAHHTSVQQSPLQAYPVRASIGVVYRRRGGRRESPLIPHLRGRGTSPKVRRDLVAGLEHHGGAQRNVQREPAEHSLCGVVSSSEARQERRCQEWVLVRHATFGVTTRVMRRLYLHSQPTKTLCCDRTTNIDF